MTPKDIPTEDILTGDIPTGDILTGDILTGDIPTWAGNNCHNSCHAVHTTVKYFRRGYTRDCVRRPARNQPKQHVHRPRGPAALMRRWPVLVLEE